MTPQLTPLAVAICTCLVVSPSAFAVGGNNGANGSIIVNPGAALSGTPGTWGNTSDGTNAPAVNDQSITLGNTSTRQIITGSAGGDGESIVSTASSGGNGGAGGASVFAGLSQGGGGGATPSGNGGLGGAITNSRIELTNIELVGAQGGKAGNATASTPNGVILSLGEGAGGIGGFGGGSVIAGLSQGGSGGNATDPNNTANGGNGNTITNSHISLTDIKLTGAIGGQGGAGGYGSMIYGASGFGAGGIGGAGGGSVFAGVSLGSAGGYSSSDTTTSVSGGLGALVSDSYISLNKTILVGDHAGAGGVGGSANVNGTANAEGGGGGGSGGIGGGSIFGGVSIGGAGGATSSATLNISSAVASGGNSIGVSNSQIFLEDVTLTGQQGGNAGAGGSTSTTIDATGRSAGAGGVGGAGGGSVFAGISIGGAGGMSFGSSSASSGGNAGAVSNNAITLNQVQFTGASGGSGGAGSTQSVQGTNYAYGSGGAGGAGGGSIFGGYSQGGSGGFSSSPSAGSSSIADGGNAADASRNHLQLNHVVLVGGTAGQGGAAASAVTRSFGVVGHAGADGGSIFGGYSAAGAGGYAHAVDISSTVSASGGAAGNTSYNRIVLTGSSSLSGSIYGGYSQGGHAGILGVGATPAMPSSRNGSTGAGGLAENNHITLVGTSLAIGGSVYGGYSLDGDNTVQNSRAFTGNTLTLDGYRGSVEGVYNFENYNWILPADVVNRDVLIEIRGNDLVDLNNTTHTVAMLSDGNRLNVNDEVVLISKAQGAHQPTRTAIQQGHFIIYDALLDINNNDEFVLTIAGKDDGTSVPPSGNTPPPTPTPDKEPIPAGRLNPTAKAFLEGRAAALALVNHGADMISEQLTECATDLFMIGDGGSSRYNTGSSVKVSDQRLAIGGRKCFELPDTSQLMLGVFAEHGTGNYHSRNHFAGVGNVRGHGDLRYTGGGLVAHMDYAGTGADISPAPVLASKDGLYVDAVLRAGHVKSDFASNQLIDAAGKRAEYTSKSHYASAMLGAGYAWNLDEQQQVDLYARYTWDRLGSDKVKVGGDELRFGNDHSARLRLGTRYNYAVTPAIAPYAGLAYEHEFDGKVSGKVFTFDIDQPELKGSSGMLEVGVRTLPFGDDSGWQVDAGVQGYVGTRKGATGSLSVKYAF